MSHAIKVAAVCLVACGAVYAAPTQQSFVGMLHIPSPNTYLLFTRGEGYSYDGSIYFLDFGDNAHLREKASALFMMHWSAEVVGVVETNPAADYQKIHVRRLNIPGTAPVAGPAEEHIQYAVATKADFRGLIAACLAFETSGSPSPSPGPPPAPKPGDVCPNCRGTGKVGDGTVSVTCQPCGGTGKVKAKEPAPTPAPAPVQPSDVYSTAMREAIAKRASLIVWVGCKPEPELFPGAVHVQVEGPWHDVTDFPARVESFYRDGGLYWLRTVPLRPQSAAPQSTSFKARMLNGGGKGC